MIGATADYGASYNEARGHYDTAAMRLKLATLRGWLRRCGVEETDLGWQTVCEVGFGGAGCLLWLHKMARQAFGIEASVTVVDRASAMGLPADRLFVADALPGRLPAPVDLWVFQDSFEHLPDPAAFLPWMAANSSPAAAVMIVCPQAGSLSERLLGRFWPHRLPDHPFHWSRRGMIGLLERHGFVAERSFVPWKRVSARVLATHLLLVATGGRGHRLPACGWLDAGFPFNIGEMGLLFRHAAGARGDTTGEQ